MRVDFLTPNQGSDTEEPMFLPALGSGAQRLRFLDFLIHEPEAAVLLHGNGILVSVPSPERFAIHKLIVSRRRRTGDAKCKKNLTQASGLLEALIEPRPYELKAAWDAAFRRGKAWRRLIGEGLSFLHPRIRERVLRTVGAPRSVIMPAALRFVPGRAMFDPQADQVVFFATAAYSIDAGGGMTIRCTIDRTALAALAGEETLDRATCLEAFARYRPDVERIIQEEYVNGKVEDDTSANVTHPFVPNRP